MQNNCSTQMSHLCSPLRPVISVLLVVCPAPPGPMMPKSLKEEGVTPVKNMILLPIHTSLLMGLLMNSSIGLKPRPLRGGRTQNCLVQKGRSTEQLKRPEVWSIVTINKVVEPNHKVILTLVWKV